MLFCLAAQDLVGFHVGLAQCRFSLLLSRNEFGVALSLLLPFWKCILFLPPFDLCLNSYYHTLQYSREWFPSICNMVCSCFACVSIKPTIRPKEHTSHIWGGKYWWSEGVTWMRISRGCVFPVVYIHVWMVYVETCVCVCASPPIRYRWQGEDGIKFLPWNVSWILLPPGDQRAVGHQWTVSGWKSLLLDFSTTARPLSFHTTPIDSSLLDGVSQCVRVCVSGWTNADKTYILTMR